MAYPSYIPTRVVTIGDAIELLTSDSVGLRLTLTASRSLVWGATSLRLENTPEDYYGSAGSVINAQLPCTNVQGYRDGRTGDIIDVSAEGSFTHTYSGLLVVVNGADVPIGKPYSIGPFTLPQGAGPVKLDSLMALNTVSGDRVSVENWIYSNMAAITAAVAAASTSASTATTKANAAAASATTATTKASEASTAAATATTKASEAAASASTAASLLNNSVRHDINQMLSTANQQRARSNIGLGTRSMGNDIVGTGRPDISATMDADTLARVNAATSGMTFYSTDGPQGAWVWRKRGSTWVCVEGDTGAVNASALLVGGDFELASLAPVFTMRREPTRVFFAGRLQLRADSPNVGNYRTIGLRLNPVPIPTGWSDWNSAYGVYVSIGQGITSGNSPLDIGTYSTYTQLNVIGMAVKWAALDPVSFTAQISIPATLAWPTTLTI